MSKPKEREFVVLTGALGKEQFDKGIELSILHMSLELLVKDGDLELEEHDNLHKMLNSSDSRDYELAKIIINSKYEHSI